MAAIALDVERRLKTSGTKPGLLTVTIKDKGALLQAYMPFVKDGGLFVPTPVNYQLGDDVFMLVSLPDEPRKISVTGRVVWVTPKGTLGRRAVGIGVQFGEQDRCQTQKRIESYLSGALGAEKPTHTM